MDQNIREVFDDILDIDLIDVIISNSTNTEMVSKIKLRPVMLKKDLFFQASEYRGTQVFHYNYKKEEVLDKLPEYFEGLFKQVQIRTTSKNVNILISKKGKATIKKKLLGKEIQPKGTLSHNRKKVYILKEDRKVPFLVDLGIMTPEGKIVSSKYDKFKQINRYLEFIEDVLPSLKKEEEINIIDFGCGKSYLTFATYYYLNELKGYNAKIIGLDLKEDVIRHCNELSKRYGYEKLTFMKGDIASYNQDNPVDMVITLHACDTATDYAMYKAVAWGAKVILSVPCCQHELNRQIKSEVMQPIFKYGLIQERMAALITDGMRARLLEEFGYKVQVMEFIDMEHTPKNILIRAVKEKDAKPDQKSIESYENLKSFLQVEPTLYQLLCK